MHVFVAGATGVLGRRIVRELADSGHDVVGLTRDDRGDDLVAERGGEPHRGDVFEPETLVAAADGADAVVHAATAIPEDANPSDEAWALNDRIRRDGTRNLVETADRVGADRFVMQSVVWVARNDDGSRFDEDADPNPDRSTQSVLDAERIVTDAATDRGFDPVVLRGGFYYGHDSGHTQQFRDGLRARRLPVLGRGALGRREARLSFVHADDAGSAFATAAVGDATGTYHVVDDEPVEWGTFLRALADRIGAPDPFNVPAWLAGLFVDDTLVRLLTSPMPTENDRFRAAFDWKPDYPIYREGLDQVVAQWDAETDD